MKIKRKSQMEVVGLLIIVIIISLVLLFVLKVVFTKKTTDTSLNYEQSKLVESFVNALFQTSSGCTPETTLKDLLIDCAKNPFSYGTITCTNGESSCTYANETVVYLLQQTLDQWGFKETGYEFVAVAPPNQNIVYYQSGDLSKSMGGETTPYPIRLYPSQQNLYVYLCIGGCGLE